MSVTATTLAYVAIAGTVAAGAATAYESHEQGVATSNQAKQKARVAAEDATAKSIASRQNMLRALASQNASTLGSIATGGASGFGANAGRQIKENQMDLATINANESAQVSLLDQQASNARQAGDFGAATDALKTAGSGIDSYLNT